MSLTRILFCLTLLGQTTLFAQIDTIHWKTVKNPLFSISYPKATWVQYMDSMTGAPFVIATAATMKKPYDRDVIQLRIMENEDGLYGDLDAYTAQFQNLQRDGEGLISAQRIKKGVVEYHEKITKNNAGKIKRKIKERRFFVNDKVYELTFDAKDAIFDKMSRDVDSLFNTFTINDLLATTVDKWDNFDKPQYSFVYPSRWKMSDILPEHTDFQMFKPQKSTDKGYRDNIYLIVNTFKESTPELGKYATKANEQLKSTLKNAVIKQSVRKKTAKFAYQEIISEGDMGKYKVKIRQWHFVKGKRAYTLTYTARGDKFEETLPIVDTIFNSFSLK